METFASIIKCVYMYILRVSCFINVYILTSNENTTPKYTSISHGKIEHTITRDFFVISCIPETDTILALSVLK